MFNEPIVAGAVRRRKRGRGPSCAAPARSSRPMKFVALVLCRLAAWLQLDVVEPAASVASRLPKLSVPAKNRGRNDPELRFVGQQVRRLAGHPCRDDDVTLIRAERDLAHHAKLDVAGADARLTGLQTRCTIESNS